MSRRKEKEWSRKKLKNNDWEPLIFGERHKSTGQGNSVTLKHNK